MSHDLLSAALNQCGLDLAPSKIVVSHGTIEYNNSQAKKKNYVPDEDAEEDIFQAETYADYMPFKLKIGLRHPDPVVETSSLSSVHPPDVWYRLAIPEDIIDEGRLSALQLEAIVYACQQHENILPDGSRSGFLIGDGAGVGKGRTVAGIIYENYLLGRKKALWLSVSNDLKYDAERDLRDIGAKKIQVYPLNKFKYGKISSKDNGGFKKGVIFATYSSLISESHASSQKYRTRLKQILHWCGDDFEGVIILDECHKAKNLCPSSGTSKSTKTGATILELQKKLPKARIVYASATGATEPRDMAYMVRLGLWGPGTSFPDFNDFISTVEKRGVGAMELVAIDMKLRGMYIARQLSFTGVQFRVEEIPLSKRFIKLYNECVELWVDAREKFEKALELMEGESSIKKAVWAQFWASHQRFFKYLCIASKVRYAVNLSREALKDEKCVVIGLQSTGEARTLKQLEENGGELNDFVSTAKAVFQSLIDKHFPAPNRKKTLKLLGLDTNPEPDPIGESILNNGEKKVSNRQRNRKPKVAKKNREMSSSSNKWSDESSDDENGKDDNGSDFEPSEDEDEDDDIFDEVKSDEMSTDSDDFSDVEPWDLYQQNMIKKEKEKGVKRKPQKSKLPRKKRGPKLTINKYDNSNVEFMSEQAGEICEKMRDELIHNLEAMNSALPPNTLDELVEELGGSDAVAEMTGRKGRVISDNNGSILYESRTENDVPLEILNLTEKQRFMDDEKRIAIISEAASSGISLHSDRRCINKRRRVHITIELPWSADRAIQQFGRTHRSNQVNAPEYVFLISDLAGEQRFASIVAKRLESLGALTHGDRRATESRDLSKYNIDTKYGRQALEIVVRSIIGGAKAPVGPPVWYRSDFFRDCREGFIGVGLISFNPRERSFVPEKDFQVMSKFLNRILGLKVEVQNAVFQYFSDTLDAVVKQAKKLGRYDLGIMDLTSDIGKVERIEHKSFIIKHSTGTAKIEFHVVKVERGMPWEDAVSLWKHCTAPEEGFYIMHTDHMIRKSVFLAVADTSTRVFAKQVFRIYKPNIGLQSKTETLTSLKERGSKITMEEAAMPWKDIFEASEKICGHQLWYNRCSRISSKLTCDVGLRQRMYHILSGSVLTIWSTIEKAVPHVQSRLQIVRLKTQDGLRVIGTLIPSLYVDNLLDMLSPNE
ncbi:protein strawberry notch isoform X2 [Brevipalpus obovatus]|uniref:protein strawberry notch isoform X2 n=1 Tax=Brevipalpus obovatus TaxID=246614 RepID=UPI003D9E36D0